MPPHPLQIVLPTAPQYPFIQDRHTFLVNWRTPVTPPPSIISSDPLNSLGSAFSNNNNPMMVAGDNIKVHPSKWTQWDQLLYYLPKEETWDGPRTTSHCARIPSNRCPYACLATWTSQNGCSIWFDQIETRISSMSAGPVPSQLLLCSSYTHYARSNWLNAIAQRRIPDHISRHPCILT